MELNLEKQTITINEVVTNETVEQAIECDAMLPDYCPDISKVLKCSICTHSGSAESNGPRLSIEGIANIRVYYQSENDGVRRCEYKVPFTKAVDMPRAISFPIVAVNPSVDYVNCRAVSPRRIDVRGALSLAIKISERKQEQIISHAEGAGLQLRRQVIKSTELCGQSESAFAVTEDLEIAYGKPAVAYILRTDCRVNVHESKIVSGKVIAKADMMLNVTYLTHDSKSLETMQFTLPLSQIVDADGVDEESVCDVSMRLVSCDVQPKADEAGEYRILGLDARVRTVVCAHRHQEIPVASDCYSTLYECSSKQQAVNFLYLERVMREMVMHRATLELPEGVSEPLDVWCEVESTGWKHEGGELIISLRMMTCMFAKMEEDASVMYFEQPGNLEHRVAMPVPPGGKILFEPSLDVLSFTYSPAGQEKVDVRGEISLRGCVYCAFSHPSVSEIELNEHAPRRKEPGKLYLYFADKDESVWDIAKSYNTSANAIWEENDVESDALPERAMLLIPIV
jgi:hypothetical protein